MASFEVQSHKQGSWTISSVQGDKDTAIYEAQRLLQSRRTTSVRVVEEVYDEDSDTYRMKVIFKRSRTATTVKKKPEEEEKTADEKAVELGFFAKLKISFRNAWHGFANSIFFLVLKFAVIIGLGLWLLIVMNDLAKIL